MRVAGQNYRLTVGVTGPTQKLVPSLNSEPFLPAADILALLFSDVRRTEDVELRALQNPTQRQTDLLSASAAETIAKPIADAGKLVQRTIGVDTFQLTPFLTDVNAQASRLNPTARLTIGKRISDRVYLTFSRSLASQINDQIILLEVDADERVSWVFSRNEDSQSYALEVPGEARLLMGERRHRTDRAHRFAYTTAVLGSWRRVLCLIWCAHGRRRRKAPSTTTSASRSRRSGC